MSRLLRELIYLHGGVAKFSIGTTQQAGCRVVEADRRFFFPKVLRIQI